MQESRQRQPIPAPQPQILDADFADFIAIDESTGTHPFLITQQNSIADYVVQQGARFTIDSQNPNNAPENNPEPDPVVNTPEIQVPQNTNLTALALKKQVNHEAIQNKDLINQFFHNVMMHFICIYLNPERTVFEQLDEFEKAIKQGNTGQVIYTLQKNKQQLVNTIHYDEKTVVINAANALNASGAIAYKGKGTVEEDLATKSDFFLSLLINHTSDSYQRKILEGLLSAFRIILSTKAPLLHTNEDCLRHAQTWINLIFKTDTRGYYISPHAIHEHPVVFFIDNDKVPTLEQLPHANIDFRPDIMLLRTRFLANCRIATVLDVVAEDHRLETKSLQISGMLKVERPASFTEIMNQIEAKLCKYATEYPLKNNAQNLNVIMPLVGCGAFGGKPADFCAPIIKNPTQLTKHGQLTLFLRHDTIVSCIKLLAPAIFQMRTEFNVPFDTLKTWWNNLQIKAVAGEAAVQKELILMNMVIVNNQQIFPRKVVQNFLRTELQLLYSSKSESNNTGKIRALEQICSYLLGKQYNFCVVMKNQLLSAINDSLSIYEKKIGFFNKFSSNPEGLNQLIKFKWDLAKKPILSYMDIHQTICLIKRMCRPYSGKFMDWDYDPTPLEACFINLKEELTEINILLCEQALPIDEQTREKRTYVVHDFFHSFFTPVLSKINNNISQHLNAIDVASMACTSRAVTKP